MDFRDWLIVVGVLIILGILADGYRRMRLAKMDSLKMSRNMGGDLGESPLDDDFNPELPSGGARIVGREQADVRIEPGFDDQAPENEEAIASAPLSADLSDRIEVSPQAGSKTDQIELPVDVEQDSPNKVVSEPTAKTKPVPEPAQQVIVINVDAKPGGTFKGNEIKQLLEACGLDHGDMSIFHRHEEDDLLSPIQFSVANAVEPGYFDPDNMDSIETPGVSFFMSMPGPKNYMKAFEYMLETAQCFAKNLNGELKDERRSVLTAQTIEHCKHVVREFERKELSKSKGL